MSFDFDDGATLERLVTPAKEAARRLQVFEPLKTLNASSRRKEKSLDACLRRHDDRGQLPGMTFCTYASFNCHAAGMRSDGLTCFRR